MYRAVDVRLFFKTKLCQNYFLIKNWELVITLISFYTIERLEVGAGGGEIIKHIIYYINENRKQKLILYHRIYVKLTNIISHE